MIDLGTDRENSQNFAPVAKGQGGGERQPRDGRIKAARFAAVGRSEREQRSTAWHSLRRRTTACRFAQVIDDTRTGAPRISRHDRTRR